MLPSPPERASSGAAPGAAPPLLFANHRGVVPMLWAFEGLAITELLVVHLFVSLKWPRIAWPLSAITAAGVVWLVWWILSWRRLPYELHRDRLTVHFGSMRRLDIALGSIDAIRSSVTSEALRHRDTLNLVPIAHPNRMIELREAMRGRRAVRRVAIRLDDPGAFDEAMQAAGIAVEGRSAS